MENSSPQLCLPMSKMVLKVKECDLVLRTVLIFTCSGTSKLKLWGHFLVLGATFGKKFANNNA